MQKRLSIKYHIAGLTILLNLFILSCVAAISGNISAQIIDESMSEYVMALADSTASMPVIQKTLFNGTPPDNPVQTIVEKLRTKTNASYMVVMDMNAIRLSHPIAARIGKPFVGGDEKEVFSGKRYVSRAVGTLGASLRAFVPVYYQDTQVGAVSVGILNTKTYQAKYLIWHKIVLLFFLCLPLSIAGAFFLAGRIKKKMLNFEPHEIAKLLSENQMVIESVKDAIIAVDMHGRITVINHAAKKILKLKQNAAGRHISTVLPNSYLEDVLSSGKEIFDTYRKLGGIPCLVTVQPIIIQHRQVGALACFRDRSEAHRLAEELTGVRKFTDELRAQAHEFSNKLHTLLGLLHFKEYKKAEALILQGAELRTQLISQLENSIESPVIRGLLYGKLATCEEKNIHIELSLPSFIPNDIGIPSQDITLVLGNFIENAIESVEHSRVPSPEIHISMLLEDSELCLQVLDNGGGIPRKIASTLFSPRPQSSKEGHRGLGLRFVKKIADYYGGNVSFSSDPEQGTVFTITLPIVSACSISTAY